MTSVHERAAPGRSTLATVAERLPVARRVWLSATAHHYRRARRILESGQAGLFALRESQARSISSAPSVYTLRGSRLRVVLRHGGSDGFVLDEIFGQRCYAFPHPVAERLGRLRRPPRVLDLGGHIGMFGLHVLGLYPDARITSVEPDPANLRLLETCIGLNAREKQWTVVPACAGTADGAAGFVSCDPSRGDFARSHVVRSSGDRELELPVRDVLPLMEAADLVKFDIEGGEWEILQDPRFRQVRPPVVVLEYHPYLCPGSDALTSMAGLLTDAGYDLGPHASSSMGEGVLWAWDRSGDGAA
jgi:FkbM family methyltransferase